MIKCKICGAECNSVSHHLKKHGISTRQYLERFPGSELKTKEVQEAYSRSAKKRFASGKMDSFLEGGKRYINSEENKERLRKRNQDPEFIESQRARLSKQMSDTNRREWSKDYDTCKQRALKNLMWDASRGSRSKLQKVVSLYVKGLGLSVKEEKPFIVNDSVIHVDIYLEDYNLVIEVNGRYWHGDPSKQSIDEMSYYQKQGYERDLIKKDRFGDNILFVWEDQVYNDDYKEIINQFLKSRGHVKLGELLET